MQEELSGASSLMSTKGEVAAAQREREGRRAVAVDEVTELIRQARERRAALPANAENLTSEALSLQVKEGLNVVLKVAIKSGNLQGTFMKALKTAAGDIQEAVGVLLNRTTSKDTAKLQEENGRLQAQIEELRQEIAAVP